MPESNTQTNNPPDSNPEPEPEPSMDSLVIDVANQHSMAVPESTIRDILLQIFHDHDWRSGEISVAIVDDSTIHELNNQHLKHDFATDVLSFVLYANIDDRMVTGEIVVSADTALNAASDHNVAPLDELLLYVIHGALHLVGLDDIDDQARVIMREAEKHYTTMFGIQYVPPAEPDHERGAD